MGSCSFPVENLNRSQGTKRKRLKEADSSPIIVFKHISSTEIEQDPRNVLILHANYHESRAENLIEKKKAAEWAQTELPEWSSLIQNALIWRDDKREEQVDHNATYPLTARFVHFIIDRIVG